MRSITVDGTDWKWRVGRSTIVAQSPSKKVHIKIHNLLGVTPDTVERAKWKKTNNCNVTPSLIANWLKKIGNE